MPEWSTIGVFATAAFVLLVTPGPAVMYIVAQSVDRGRRAGVVSAFGVGAGILVHLAAAVLGVSAVLTTSATAFSVVKYAGAAYLIVLGVKRFLDRDEAHAAAAAPRALSRVFLQGFVVNVLNPKTALFFFAFLPQFVDPARGSATLQLVVLGSLFLVMALASDSTYALVAGTAAKRLRASERVRRYRRAVTGTTYVALGVTAAVAGRGRQ